MGDYEVVGPLGNGAFGEVVLVRAMSGSLKAAKLLRVGQEQDDKALQLEMAGLRAYESISEAHGSLLSIHHIGRFSDGLFYVMELADPLPQAAGSSDHQDYVPRTLQNELKLRKRLSVQECLEIGITLASALDHLHAHGLVHRDVKPSNVIRVKGALKLADIGLVHTTSLPSATVGTPGFVPREGAGTPSGDIYALGKLLYEALTGNDVSQWPSLPKDLVAGPDAELFRLINECLTTACDPEPRQRFLTAAAFGEDLRGIKSGIALKWAKLSRRQQRLRTLGIAAGSGALFLLFLLWSTNRARGLERQQATRLIVANANRSAEAGDLASALLWGTHALLRSDIGSNAETLHRLRIGCFQRDVLQIEGLWVRSKLVRSGEFSPDGRYVAFSSEGDHRAWIARVDAPREAPLSLDHSNAVGTVRFSPDSRLLLTIENASGTGIARVWSVATGERTGPPIRHSSVIRDVAFHPRAMEVALCDDQGWIRIWNPTNGVELASAAKHGGSVRRVSYSPQGDLLLTASWDETAALWRRDSMQAAFPPMKHAGYVRSAAMSMDGRWIATCGDDHLCQLWDFSSGLKLHREFAHGAPVRTISFSPDGRRLVTASEDQTARIWDVTTGRMVGKPMLHKHSVPLASFSSDGTMVVTGGRDGIAQVWDARSGDPLFSPLRHNDEVSFVEFSPDGRFVLSASWAGLVRLWRLPTPWRTEFGAGLARNQRVADWPGSADHFVVDQILSEVSICKLDASSTRVLRCDHSNSIEAVQFSPTGPQVATGSLDGRVKVWDYSNPKVAPKVLEHQTGVVALAYSPSGTRMATGTIDRRLLIWNVESGALAGRSEPLSGEPRSLVFTPDGSLVLASSHSDKRSPKSGQFEATVHSASDGRRLFGVPHRQSIVQVAADPGGRLFATASRDGSARVWEVRTGAPVTPPLKHHAEVVSCALSSDGRWIASGSSDNTARIWNIKTGRATSAPLWHDAPVLSVGFSPDGRLLLTGCENGICRVWDVESGQPITQPLKHSGKITLARFSPDGKRVFVSSRSEATVVWDLVPSTESASQLQHIASLLTSSAVDDDGSLAPLATEEALSWWLSRRASP